MAGRLPIWLTAAALVAVFTVLHAQDAVITSHMRGQSVAPAFEGWEENLDGSFNLVFGYFNRNWDEALTIPVGANNTLEPGGPDQGQPTHFLPRRNRFIFRIRVPKDFGTKEVVWTLTSNGETEKAYGTLKPGYYMDDDVIVANMGVAPGSTTLELQNLNRGPSLEVPSPLRREVRVGDTIDLVAVANDDGIPKKRELSIRPALSASQVTIASALGLRLSWFVYRGDGAAVVFDPPQFKTYEDTRWGSPWAPGWKVPPVPDGNKWLVHATFKAPGTYVLRCLAHDGAMMTARDITVTVK